MAVGGSKGGGDKGVKAGRAYVEVGVDEKGLRAGLDKAKRAVMGFGKGVAAGGGILAGMGAGVTAPILKFFHDGIDRLNQFRKAAAQLGSTTEIMSGLGYAAEKVGVDLNGLVGAGRKLQRSIADAVEGDPGKMEAFAKLGLDAKALIDLPLDQQLEAIGDGLKKINNPAMRQNTAFDVLGKAGVQLLPILAKGGAGLRDVINEGKDLGAIVKTEDAERAKTFSAAMAQAKNAIKFFFQEIGLSILPQAEQFASYAKMFTTIVKQVRELAEKNRPLIASIFLVGAAMTAAGSAIIALGTAIFLAGVAIGGIMTAISALGSVLAVVFSPVGLGVAAIAVAMVALVALAAETETFWETLETGASIAKSVWGEVLAVFNETWQGIKDAFAAGDLKLAFQIGLAGLNVLWKEFLLVVQVAWNEFKGVFVDGWTDAVTGIEIIWNNASSAIADSVLKVLQFLAENFGKFFKTTMGAAADVAEIFDSDLAKKLRAISETDAATFGDARGIVEADRKAKQKEILAAGEKAKADAAATRAAAALAAALDVLKAKEELTGKVAEAAAKKVEVENDAMMDKFLKDMMGAHRPGQAAAISAMGGIRSQFGGTGLGALEVNAGSVQKEQLDELKAIRENTEEMGMEGW